ncbi:glycosyltransferase family 21 protein, partial [Glonium stellatum]
MLAESVAWVCLAWYCFIVIVCSIGYVQLYRSYTRPPRPATCLTTLPPSALPHITIIRPVKGLEPRLHACLASTFRQTYPRDKLSIRFCVATRADPAFPVLQRLKEDFLGFDLQVLVEEEDPVLHPEYSANGNVKSHGGSGRSASGNRAGAGTEAGTEMPETHYRALGPNPKIRNMSRAYREAKGDVVWIVDCNVWVDSGVAGRMVDLLEGYGEGRRPHKFVHQLPLVVDVPPEAAEPGLVPGDNSGSGSGPAALLRRLTGTAGGRLEELFMSSSHAKFYTAINTVLVAPCIVGKSNMFRRSHLAALTSPTSAAGSADAAPRHRPGIDFFSDNICEDHLIGDMLWKKPQPFEIQPPATRTLLPRLSGWGFLRERKPEPSQSQSASPTAPQPPQPTAAHPKKFGNHALLHGSPCIQPLSTHPLTAYLHRRVRWLRVRKFTVLVATLVEPGTESLLCSLYGAHALTTLP